ncbi:HlyD family secretion protein [Sporomusa acidovorans]|uniref:Colistin resistance protein EmrA n=1 Tax=Sporomusa acidovorans (strain ATCC 49682 / DSM 3132 / Mol) TaxID=1123286 RepID=A0ABZ3J8Z7_SPOA4|nr:HlyD family secretion protein [Sporomusa acidovorans]OZC15971.1 putative multidrug resistance protein EmrK [Sporomusa acidovorans DSM 3132]SDD91600.1 membrane fusion protein, multidrug efflux system [Sporomusa acidovorans]
MSDRYQLNKHKITIAAGIFFLLAGLAGGGWWWYQSTKLVSTDDARVSGTIVSIGPKISGRIAEVLVKEGDTVQTGQILARIDVRDAAVQKKQAEAALATAKAKYDAIAAGSRPQEIGQARAGAEQAQAAADQALANLRNAEKTYQRMSKLYEDGAISTTQRDNAETAYLMAKESWKAACKSTNSAGQKLDLVEAGSREEEIRAAAAQVQQAEAALEAASLNNEYTDILSPVDGIIALKDVNSGEVVTVGQTLFSVVDSKDLWLNARIEETKIGKIKLNQTVDYTIDGYPGRTFTGEVYEIGIATNSTFALVPTENTSGNFTKVTQRIPIKITLPENSGIVFRPGMQALIDIHLQ